MKCLLGSLGRALSKVCHCVLIHLVEDVFKFGVVAPGSPTTKHGGGALSFNQLDRRQTALIPLVDLG